MRHKRNSGCSSPQAAIRVSAGVGCMESVCEKFKWKYNSISSQGLRWIYRTNQINLKCPHEAANTHTHTLNIQHSIQHTQCPMSKAQSVVLIFNRIALDYALFTWTKRIFTNFYISFLVRPRSVCQCVSSISTCLQYLQYLHIYWLQLITMRCVGASVLSLAILSRVGTE